MEEVSERRRRRKWKGGKVTYEDVYKEPFKAPRQDKETIIANKTPPIGPAKALPKSNPIVEVAVAFKFKFRKSKGISVQII